MVGHSLGPVGNLLQMNVQQALAADPQTRIAIPIVRTRPEASSSGVAAEFRAAKAAARRRKIQS
jgi:hypothetical protein